MVMIIDMTNGEVEDTQVVQAPVAAEMQCPDTHSHELDLALVEISTEIQAPTFPEALKDVDMEHFIKSMEQSAGR